MSVIMLPHPYGIHRNVNQIKKMKTKTKRGRVSKKRQKINDLKKSAPGVPTNTCPYIDHVIAMVEELRDMHDDYHQKGVQVPMFDRKVDLIKEHLEFVRSANETLRDNSLYWYNSLKKEV